MCVELRSTLQVKELTELAEAAAKRALDAADAADKAETVAQAAALAALAANEAVRAAAAHTACACLAAPPPTAPVAVEDAAPDTLDGLTVRFLKVKIESSDGVVCQRMSSLNHQRWRDVETSSLNHSA